MRGMIVEPAAGPAQRGVVVMPARVERDDVRLALAQGARRTGPAPELDIAGLVELVFVVADERFQIAGGKLAENLLVPRQLRVRVALGAGEMRHASARQDDGLQPERGDG